MNMAKRNFMQGFTLLEMLVVMVITSFVVGLLMESLSQMYRLLDRFGVETTHAGSENMALGWWRDSIQGLWPDLPNGKHPFKGEARELTGLSLTPASIDFGLPKPIHYQLIYDARSKRTQLLSGDPATPLMSWAGNGGRFLYLGEDKQWVEQWPPPFGVHAQLPRAVMLQSDRDGQVWLSAAAPLGTRDNLAVASNAAIQQQ